MPSAPSGQASSRTPAPGWRALLSAGLYFGLCLLTLGEALTGWPADSRPLGLGLFLFLALELTGTSRMIAASAAVLIALGLIAGGGSPALLLLDGAVRTLPFLVLFLAVLCLQGPALRSPTLRRIGDYAAHQPTGRRFLGFALAGHLLGAVLNMAGLLLVLSLLDPKLSPSARLRLTTGAMRGFSAAAIWSPVFVAMSVVLSVLPGLRWSGIAWRAILLAAAVLALAWLWNAMQRSSEAGGTAGSAPARPPGTTWLAAAAILSALLVPVILLFEVYHFSIPIALGLVAPVMAAIWQGAQGPAGERAPAVSRRAAAVFAALPGLRNEALLFFAANVFGLGLSAWVDPAALAGLLEILPGHAIRIPVLVLFGILLAGLGVHPIVVVVAVGNVLSPAVLGLSVTEVALVLLVIWGLGTAMSPFSGTILQVARLTNTSPFTIAWRWNAPFCLAAAIPVSAALALLGGLG
ncbi:MAG TPA: hypothetical protein VLL72_03610 [Kiloniellales bacterium]|nr:hypothetical protein [Kiloniellales bacterium]